MAYMFGLDSASSASSDSNSMMEAMVLDTEDINPRNPLDDPWTTASTRQSEERAKAFEQVAENAVKVWPTLPLNWQHDKEFILKALYHAPLLPPKADFERKFPQRLRFDKEVVLGFCQRSDFVELYYQRHLFVPGSLSGDKQVMMAYCQKIPRSLQECTEELCGDREVVQAAIQLGGLELQYASRNLQEDPSLVVQACQSHGRALEYCPPGPTRDALCSDREFMLKIVLAKPGGGPMWKLLPLELQNDEELLLQALKHGLLLRDIPTDKLADTPFLERAIQGNACLYLELPKQKQPIMSIALQAIVAPDSTPEIHERALQLCPPLARNRQAVLAICHRGDVNFLQDLLQNSLFSDDLEVMRLAISRDSKLFATASQRLQELPEIILVSITDTSAWNTLKTVPWNIQRQHPEITIKAIQLCLLRNLRYLPSHIPEDLWANNRHVCLAWIQRGGRVLEAFERLLRGDAELALQVAKHNWSEFHKVGENLLSDRGFMLEALQQDGRVLRFAAPPLRQDFEILVMAIAHHYTNHAPSDIPHVAPVATTFAGICNLQELQKQIQTQLDLQKTFLCDFLRGVAICTPHIPPPRRSPLNMLDRGVETSQAFKELIAEYLGVPIGPRLKLLRKAHDNLKNSPSGDQEPAMHFGGGRSRQNHPLHHHGLRHHRHVMRRRFFDMHQARRNMHMENMDGDETDDDEHELEAGLQHHQQQRLLMLQDELENDLEMEFL